jgi:hypothetical protein
MPRLYHKAGTSLSLKTLARETIVLAHEMVRCICCQVTRKVRGVLMSTSCTHLSLLQLRNVSKGNLWFSAPSFNYIFKDFVTEFLTVSLKYVVLILNLALQTGTANPMF